MSGSGATSYTRSSQAAIVRAECDIPGFYVRRVQVAADGEPDMALLVAKPHDESGNEIRFERAQELMGQPGRTVVITGDAGSGTRQTLLHGRLLSLEVRAGGRGEEIVATVLGLKHELMTERLFGCWSRDSQGEAIHLQGIPLVFNPDGKPNMDATDLEDLGGRRRIVFNHDHGNEDGVEFWTAAKMARYVATAERKDDAADIERIFETTATPGSELGDITPFTVNLEGESIWNALVRIAMLCSRGVCFRYGKSRGDSTLRFFTKKTDEAASSKQFEFPRAGGPISINDRGRLADSVDLQRDWAAITSQFDAVAPPKLWEDEFELVEGWTQADQDAAFGSGSAITRLANFLRNTDPELSSDWERFKYVGRRWILNETGRDDVLEEDAEPYDFSSLFGAERYAERFRPFRRQRATKDSADQPLDPLLYVKFSSVAANVQLGGLARLLPDRAGIYFHARPMVLPARFLESGSSADLFPDEVKLTACVEGDQAAPFGIFGSAFPNESLLPTFGLVRLDDGFRQDNINEDEGEDRAQALVDEAADEAGHQREIGTVTSPFITNQFQVGDVIDRINGRNLAMKAIIMKVCWDFENQSTEFALQIPEIDTETHSRDPKPVRNILEGAETDKDFRAIRDLLGHSLLGHPVERMLRDSLRAFDPFDGHTSQAHTVWRDD